MTDYGAVFHMTFRSNPFGSGFRIACGPGYLIDYIGCFRFGTGDIARSRKTMRGHRVNIMQSSDR
jgi:nicotinic acid phosphoribosyltransferase